MRSQAGTPNETQFTLRQGYSVSHCDENQGDFTLHAKGAPLVTLSLVGYAIHGDGPFAQLYKQFGWHSRVRFGAMTNTGGWPGGGALGGIPAHAFSDSADYARAVGDYGPQRWTRQAAFLKAGSNTGSSYVVLRDSFEAVDRSASAPLQSKWWSLRTLGSKDQVRLNEHGLSYSSAIGPKLAVRLMQPAQVASEVRDASQQTPLYFVTARNWVKAGSPVVRKEGSDNVTVQDTLSISAFGPVPAGQDILVTLYPHLKDEPVPEYTSLGDGVARIVSKEAADTVFLAPKPIGYSDADMSLEGVAGAVRVFPTEVHLIISEGPGTVSYRGTTLRSDVPTVKVVSKADVANNQRFNVEGTWKLASNVVLPKGCRVEGPARCELQIAQDRMSGRSEGYGGLLYAPMPAEMKVLPTLVVDGQTYAPGTSGNTLIIPLLPGEHKFEIRPLEQPAIFRNWQAW